MGSKSADHSSSFTIMSDKSADTPPAISISPFSEEYLKSFTFLGDTNDLERRWTELQPEFDRLGYRFRPRHRPGWTPSWDISDPFSRHEHEDSIPLPVRRSDTYFGHMLMYAQEEDVIDAVRVVDNARVCIKMLTADEEGKTEVGIASFLGTSSDGRRTPTVPVLDTVVLPDRPDLLFLVMPELLMWNCVPFEHVDEVLDFVRQMLFVRRNSPVTVLFFPKLTHAGPTLHAFQLRGTRVCCLPSTYMR